LAGTTNTTSAPQDTVKAGMVVPTYHHKVSTPTGATGMKIAATGAEAKRKCKEATRAQLLSVEHAPTNMLAANWLEGQERQRTKQAALIRVMPAAKNKNKPAAKPASKPKAGTKLASKTKPVAKKGKKQPVINKGGKEQLNNMADDPTQSNGKATAPVGVTLKLCGCRHGDLSALKSFNKASTTYYTRRNRYLAEMDCLDCGDPVVALLVGAPKQKPVVFYCDEGIKGFDAPIDDPMKQALTCNLVLCPLCEAKRRITFEQEDNGRGGRGRKRIRQQAGK
jgi:hypothetical protein